MPSYNKRNETLFNRVHNMVAKTDSCWIWIGWCDEDGYGKLRFRKKNMMASRASWIAHYGQIPDGFFVCHKCDNPACARPDHLFLGTPQDNTDDMVKKNRAATGIRSGVYTKPESRCKGERNGHAKLTEGDVVCIRARFKAGGVRKSELAREYGITQTAIGYIVNGKNWAHL